MDLKKEIYVAPSLEVVTLRVDRSILAASTGSSLSWGEDREELDYFD